MNNLGSLFNSRRLHHILIHYCSIMSFKPCFSGLFLYNTSYVVQSHSTIYRQNVGIYDSIFILDLFDTLTSKELMGKLTGTTVKQIKASSNNTKLSDGGGLYLLVTKGGGKYWRYDYRFAGKRKTLAIGTYPDVTLLNARRR